MLAFIKQQLAVLAGQVSVSQRYLGSGIVAERLNAVHVIAKLSRHLGALDLPLLSSQQNLACHLGAHKVLFLCTVVQGMSKSSSLWDVLADVGRASLQRGQGLSHIQRNCQN